MHILHIAPAPWASRARAGAAALLLGAGLLGGCAMLPPGVERTPSQAVAASAQEALGRLAAASVADAGGSAFRPLPLSSYAMDARLTLVRQAQRTLDVQYYLLENDLTGHTLARALRDAAARGVRVRLLVDDLYTADSEQMLLGLAAHPNVEVRLFNPFPSGRWSALTRWLFALGDFSRINHRTHNKMLIADGAFAIAGGRNIADEYFFTSQGGNFIDFDLLVAGDALPRMQAIFDTYWNSPRIYPLQAVQPTRRPAAEWQADFERLTADAVGAYPAPPPEPDLLGWQPLSADIATPPLRLLQGRIDVFADDPEKVSGRAETGRDTTTVTARVGRAVATARTEVVIGSPYFIPGEPGLAAMRQALDNAVRIEVITNSLASNDEPFASAAYGRYRVQMLKMGVALYEVDSRQLHNDSFFAAALHSSIGRSHSKLIVIDRRVTFVGSMNLDLRSSRLNTELGMLVDSPALAQQVLALAARVRDVGSYRLRLAQPGDRLEWVGQERGADKVWDHEPDVDLRTRLQLWLVFPFVSESLL